MDRNKQGERSQIGGPEEIRFDSCSKSRRRRYTQYTIELRAVFKAGQMYDTLSSWELFQNQDRCTIHCRVESCFKSRTDVRYTVELRAVSKAGQMYCTLSNRQKLSVGRNPLGRRHLPATAGCIGTVTLEISRVHSAVRAQTRSFSFFFCPVGQNELPRSQLPRTTRTSFVRCLL